MLKKILPFIKARFAPRGARQIFSQYAEDIIMLDILKKKGIHRPSYIDIGAHHPIFGNNTYLFYRAGGDGVLVEPNPEMCRIAEKKRPRDTVVNAGAGARDGEADFYMFSQSTRSTFSKEQAREWEFTSGQKPTVEKKRIISLDSIFRDYCTGGAPDIVSIDAEGLDAEIIGGLSWKARPKIFCIESDGALDALMKQHGYELKARIFQNSIFADSKL
jgi:FkbM family methyltransferase